jgi:hypothetical protein
VGYVISLQRNLLEGKALQANNNLERVLGVDANFPVSAEASEARPTQPPLAESMNAATGDPLTEIASSPPEFFGLIKSP